MLKKNISVKIHPDDQFDYGFPITTDLNEVVDKVEIFWGANSSAILQIGRAGYRVGLHEESDFLQYIDSKYYKRKGDFFIIDQKYDWKPFIDLTGDKYLEALEKKCF